MQGETSILYWWYLILGIGQACAISVCDLDLTCQKTKNLIQYVEVGHDGELHDCIYWQLHKQAVFKEMEKF